MRKITTSYRSAKFCAATRKRVSALVLERRHRELVASAGLITAPLPPLSLVGHRDWQYGKLLVLKFVLLQYCDLDLLGEILPRLRIVSRHYWALTSAVINLSVPASLFFEPNERDDV